MIYVFVLIYHIYKIFIPGLVGGPRKDCPISASIRATFNPLWQRLKIKNLARVLFPVSVAPRRIVMPLSLSKTSKRAYYSLGAIISVNFILLG
jgi:hypothetical protein